MASPAPTWELADQNLAPFRCSREEILRLALSRRLSLQASVRASPNQVWTPIAASEFAAACPDLLFLSAKASKTEDASGVVAVNANPEALLGSSRRTRALADYAKLGFFLPLLTDHPGPPFTADAALFQLWSGVFAGVIVESRALRPDMFLHVYIVAFNLSASPQTHALVPGEYKIPDEQRHLLTFSLGPWRWEVHRMFIPVPPTPGRYEMELRSTSGAAKAGKAIAATALTLGMFTYIPGHKGFTVPFQVLAPDALSYLDSFESACVKVVADEFARQGVDHGVGPMGAIPRADFLQRFGQYLRYNPERTLLTNEEEKDGDKAFERLYGRYMMQEYGGAVTIGTPDATKPS